MLKAGLTGGYATGKSFVAARLEELGCFVIYADHLGHQVLRQGGEAYAPTVAAFGPDILETNGEIDRKRLGDIVFASEEKLALLSSFVHPAVYRREDSLVATFAHDHPNGIAVVEAAILIETGRFRDFDRLIVTYCSEEQQIARAMARDHETEERVRARLRLQLPLDKKRSMADYAIDTGGTLDETREQVDRLYETLRIEAAA